MNLHHTLALALPALLTLMAAPLAALFTRAASAAHHAAESIHDERLRRWASTLVTAAEQQFTRDGSGAEKKAYVLAGLQKLFPHVPYTVLSVVVEAAVAGIKQDPLLESKQDSPERTLSSPNPANTTPRA